MEICEETTALTCCVIAMSLMPPLFQNVMGNTQNYSDVQLINYILKKMVIKNALRDQPGNTHFVPVKQETIYQSPYYFFVVKLFMLFNCFEFLYPFLAQFLFDFDFLLFIEVIVASMIRWDNTRLLDATKELNETIP